MSSGNYAHNTDTVTDNFVNEICPDEYAALAKILIDNKSNLDGFASVATYEGDIFAELESDYEPDIARAMVDAYVALLMAFSEKTDLGLAIRYHVKEDRGDMVDGMFWEVEGVYIYSPAGEKYKKYIENKSWTTYG
jgi:hypothetical protein